MYKVINKPVIGDDVVKVLPCPRLRYGCFAVYVSEENDPIWKTCREEFSRQWLSHTSILFSLGSSVSMNRVANFIRHFERILTIYGSPYDTDFTLTSFNKTNLDWAIRVDPSPFWSSSVVRRQLFTILLRCGKNYDPENEWSFDDALFSDQEGYSLTTKNAVLRFLAGNVRYGDVPQDTIVSSWGWVSTFGSASGSESLEQKACNLLNRYPDAKQMPETTFNSLIGSH